MSGAAGRSGGARVGAGRRPERAATLALRGGRDRLAQDARRPVETTPEPVEAPTDLPEDQRSVWNLLAPQALEQRTLTRATAVAFRDLCEAIVVKRAMLAQIDMDGMTLVDRVSGAVRAHPLLAKHQGMMVRVETAMARFRLNPDGRPAVAAEAPKDDFAEFDGPQLVQKGA